MKVVKQTQSLRVPYGTINLAALFQVVMEVCCVDKEWISVEKLTYFVEKYHSYVKLNNNHFNDR
jgi:hypothetical protein